MKFKPTEEQQDILNYVKKSDENFKIEAFAGTGKTSTLEMIVRKNPQRHFLILAFNKSIADELKMRLQDRKNKAVFTTHSLALYLLRKYRLLKSDIVNNNYLLIQKLQNTCGGSYAINRLAVEAFEAFCNSGIPFDKLDKVSLTKIIKDNPTLRNKVVALSITVENIYDSLYERIEFLFKKMMRGELPITHSFYLKYFTEVWSASNGEIDTILLDEAQDVNPVQIKMVEVLKPKRVILVGDRHQSIYGWRGAYNSMALFDYPKKALTISFRFAFDRPVSLSNSLLSFWKGEKKKLKRADITKKRNGSFGLICRDNITLILKVFEEVWDERFKTVKPLNELFKELFIADKIVDYFESRSLFSDKELLKGVPYHLAELAKSCDSLAVFVNNLISIEPSMANAVKIAMKYSIQEIYDDLASRWDKNAALTALTAHTSKGLEFDTVYLGKDFSTPKELFFQFIEEF
jgi:superfamily I DNA/RNA helicase